MRANNYLPLLLLLTAATYCLAASSSQGKKSKDAVAAATSKQSDEVSSTAHQAKASARQDSSPASSSVSSAASPSQSASSSIASAAAVGAISHKESSKSGSSSREQQPAEVAAEAELMDPAIEAQQQEHQLQQQMREDQQQEAADKKQGEQQNVDDTMDSLAASEEYVQIKPEEADMSGAGKDLDPTVSLIQPSDQQSAGSAEHKAVDDELNAHLAQESIYHPAIVPLKSGAPRAPLDGPRAGPNNYHHFAPPMQPLHPIAPPRPMGYPPARQLAGPRPHATFAPKPVHHQPQPGYTALKGKLTGINSLISQYPHPAPGYPHQGPRHLPRGAAAGYAAFRDFVRAHASKYKHAAAAAAAAVPQPPLVGGLPEPTSPSKDYSKELPQPAFVATSPQLTATGGYPASGSNKAPGYVAAPARPAQYGASQAPKAQRLTVAQAYIPHLSPASAATNHGASSHQPASYGANPILAGLYGQHAPQGAGKPEYSQDFGMVIHYPQATVYTEPMSVDQLHKLTGAGITQVLSQLQYNLAHGHRDESNTIRPNNAHHIGNGLHIHAKEFYAPGKSGNYVPTTAAVISGPAPAKQQGYDQPAASDHQQQPTGGDYASPNLGSGYERVKQAVAASQDRYNRYAAQGNQPQQQQQYGKQPAAGPQAATGYGVSGSNQYGGNAEPLSAITNFLSSEIEALHKANDAYAKPEMDAYTKSVQAKGPLRYENLGAENQPPRSYGPGGAAPYNSFGSHHQPQQMRGPRPPVYALPGAAMLRGPPNRYHAGPRGQRGPRRGPHGPRSARYPGAGRHQRPMPPAAGPFQPQYPARGPRPQQQSAYRQHGSSKQQQNNHGYRQQQQQQQHQQAIHAATEQALNQQMMQLMQDFQAGDEQYNGKSQPSQPASQGYPHKVMQKYSQYRHQSYKQQPSAYAQAEGLELPQGPNDQIGEIAELIEALKNTLESRKPEASETGQYGSAATSTTKQPAANLEDIRYLTTVLGQMPTYPIQVPVGPADGAQAAYEQAKKGPAADSYQQSAAAAAAPASEHQQASAYQAQQPAVPTQQQTYEQSSAADQYQQAAKAVDPAASAGYQAPAAHEAYGQQQSSQAQVDSYSAAMQQVRATLAQAQAHTQTANYGQHVVAGSYPQAAAGADQQQTSAYYSNYSNSEHAQVINHLVPAAQQQQGYAGDQTAPQQHQQPANQIAVAAPTEAQYQQAQSLSSFVDSLPTDYQELLRQPASLDGQSGGQQQLAVLGQEGQYPAHANATTSATSGQHASSAYGTSYQLTQTQTQTQAQAQHPTSSASQQQAYQQPQASAKSASHEASGAAQQGQYAASVKK